MASAPTSPAKGVLARFSRVGESIYSARRKIATAAAALLTITMGYHVVFGQNGLTAYRTKRHDERELIMQMQTLTRDNEELRGHVNRLSSDPNAIEHEAREELHYTRPGEVIYTMPTNEKPTASATK
jgi:cell division protein FtsB